MDCFPCQLLYYYLHISEQKIQRDFPITLYPNMPLRDMCGFLLLLYILHYSRMVGIKLKRDFNK